MEFLPWQRGNAIRSRIVEVARWGVAHNGAIHYAQVRPIPTHLPPRHLPITTDCSGFATLCYLWAGATDPNGAHYSGAGFTGTLLEHGRHIGVGDCRPGDLIVYGPAPGHHVVIVIVAGRDPLVASHGDEAGPILTHHSGEQEGQPRPATGLRFRVQ